jgi:hypothetical protein
VVIAFALGGCGGGSATPTASESAAKGDGEPWILVEPGKPTPSAKASAFGAPKPALPPASFLPNTNESCKIAWPEYQGQVFIPLLVTPGSGSLKVQWPNRYGNTYRVAAVQQSLVSGAQPEPAWKTVTTGSECEASATITGLGSGAAYMVWLDAPSTPRNVDGTRSLYTGRSGIVKPL